MAQKNKSANQVRIIGGKFRGRKIHFPNNPLIRPTPDRIRETLFNWLTPFVSGASCLDLFAGSGALGLEALSRDAAYVTFIEPDRLSADSIKKHLSLFEIPAHQAQVFSFYLPHPLPFSNKVFDIIFIDPPFFENWIDKISHWLEQQDLFSSETYIYIEAEKNLHPLPIPVNWQIIKNKTAGQVSYYLIKRNREVIN